MPSNLLGIRFRTFPTKKKIVNFFLNNYINIDFSKISHDTFFCISFQSNQLRFEWNFPRNHYFMSYRTCSLLVEEGVGLCIVSYHRPKTFYAGNVMKSIPNKFEGMFTFTNLISVYHLNTSVLVLRREQSIRYELILSSSKFLHMMRAKWSPGIFLAKR